MKHTCQHCGHVSEIEPQQARAGRATWAAMTPEERSAEMSRRRKKGIKRKSGPLNFQKAEGKIESSRITRRQG